MASANAIDWDTITGLTAGEYLAHYDDVDAASDPGSRCGYDDAELDEIKQHLRGRDLRIETDDVGLRVIEVQS